MATNITQTETNFTGYYINNVNYIIGSIFRLCIVLDNSDKLGGNDTSIADFYKDSDDSHKMKSNIKSKSNSNFTYTYTPDGFQHSGGYCMDVGFNQSYYNGNLSMLIGD